MRPHNPHNGERSPEQILAEIENTRQEMDSTLNAIEQRLTPGQLLDQGLDYVRNSGARQFVDNLGGQVRNNPLPVALVGIGLAWLMASSKRPPELPEYDTGPSVGQRAGEMMDRASGTVESAKHRVTESAQAVRERMSSAASRVSELGHSARQRASEFGYQARHRVERARSGVDTMIREQPLALGAIGLAVGALFGSLAPRTRQEDELMGDTRDRLMDQAKEAGREKLEQAKEVANTALGAASKEAEQRGLKPASGSQSAKPGAPQPNEGQSSKPIVSVHHSYSDAPTQSVPPTPQNPARPSGGTRNIP